MHAATAWRCVQIIYLHCPLTWPRPTSLTGSMPALTAWRLLRKLVRRDQAYKDSYSWLYTNVHLHGLKWPRSSVQPACSQLSDPLPAMKCNEGLVLGVAFLSSLFLYGMQEAKAQGRYEEVVNFGCHAVESDPVPPVSLSLSISNRFLGYSSLLHWRDQFQSSPTSIWSIRGSWRQSWFGLKPPVADSRVTGGLIYRPQAALQTGTCWKSPAIQRRERAAYLRSDYGFFDSTFTRCVCKRSAGYLRYDRAVLSSVVFRFHWVQVGRVWEGIHLSVARWMYNLCRHVHIYVYDCAANWYCCTCNDIQ